MEPTTQELAKLEPFINGAQPDERGEVEMYCPIHNDTRRSASLNVRLGVWYCHAGCGGGSVRHLVEAEDQWLGLEERHVEVKPPSGSAPSVASVDIQALEDKVQMWHEALMGDKERLRYLYELRGLHASTARKAVLGWDGRYFKIPVFSPERKLWNLRTYDPKPKWGRRKIWSERGLGRARIYPAGVLEHLDTGDSVIFCEGEWDALLSLQTGFQTVTRTDGAGKPWHPEWNVGFAGLDVYVCHDRDTQGSVGDDIVAAALSQVATVKVCKLPYSHRRKGGRDLTDFILDAEAPKVAMKLLLELAKPYEEASDE
jgi:hypothetical protein